MHACLVTRTSFWRLIDRCIQRGIRQLSTPAKWALTYVYPARPGLGSHLQGTTDDGPIDHAQQYGVASVPPPGDRMVVITVPISNSAEHNVVVGELDHTGARPTDLAIGDVCLYTGGGQRVWLKIDGTIRIVGPSGSSIEIAPGGAITLIGVGGHVNLGGTGGAAVARQGDGVAQNAAMTAWMSAVSTALQAANPLIPGLQPIGDIGTISAGSSVVKAVS